MKELSEVAFMEALASITFQLRSSWDTATSAQKVECIQKASEARKMICQIIAPKAGDMLYQSLSQEENVSNELIALMTAYAKTHHIRLSYQTHHIIIMIMIIMETLLNEFFLHYIYNCKSHLYKVIYN